MFGSLQSPSLFKAHSVRASTIHSSTVERASTLAEQTPYRLVYDKAVPVDSAHHSKQHPDESLSRSLPSPPRSSLPSPALFPSRSGPSPSLDQWPTPSESMECFGNTGSAS